MFIQFIKYFEKCNTGDLYFKVSYFIILKMQKAIRMKLKIDSHLLTQN